MKANKFNFTTIAQLRAESERLGIDIPLDEDVSVLKSKINVNGKTLQNRIVFQPMEGCDGNADGSLGEHTVRRYEKFAGSGAALIWFEAVAVVNEGRANPRQLMINPSNMDAFKAAAELIKDTGLKKNGFEPVVIMQLTHSGRYAKPDGQPLPVVAYNSPLLEKNKPIPKQRIITDAQLEALEDSFGEAAKLAQACGFDGVDLKACHRYLVSELLSAYKRPGKYGGAFENRTRFLRNIIKAAKAKTDDGFIVATRLNVYDGFAYPYGFGVKEGGGTQMDLSEAYKLADQLFQESGVSLINVTLGNPYVNPHVNRPSDNCGYETGEHPLWGVERAIKAAGALQKKLPHMSIVCSALSYLRQFSVNAAAGAINAGMAKLAGFGRMTFAYPDFAKDLFEKGQLDAGKCCIACGNCSKLMRAGQISGCVIRDKEYAKIFKEKVQR